MRIHVGADRFLVNLELVEALEQSVKRNNGVPEGDADIAGDGRVGEVTLQAGDGELFGEMPEDGVGEAKVALRILEVDGVDLVGHGGGADLARLRLLLEEPLGDVGPDVPAEVNEDGVDALAGVEKRSHVVVVLNLRRHLVPLQPKAVDKSVGKRDPIPVPIRNPVCVHVAGGTPKLGTVRHRIQKLHLGLKAVNEDHQLLAHAGGGRGLPVGPGQERDLRPLAGEAVERGDDVSELGHVDGAPEAHDHQRVAGVVDVLRREPKVDELLDLEEALEAGGAGHLGHLVLEEVLHSLDIVVGREGGAAGGPALELRLLDPGGVLVGELGVDPAELRDEGVRGRGHGRELGEGRGHAEEADEVLDLNLNAMLDVSILGEVGGDGIEAAAVAPVEGPDGVESRCAHACFLLPSVSREDARGRPR
mmetsp:Transcript_32461/g.79174  ORF Transcript_32461/g.79174 Transcript_32461/m.79174 type:complete len:420 (-) Transcript_32461:5-1264(-)